MTPAADRRSALRRSALGPSSSSAPSPPRRPRSSTNTSSVRRKPCSCAPCAWRSISRFGRLVSYRHFFRKLKFLRLLYTLTHGEDGAYHLSIDGPYSLFDSVTRYGLSLALLLPLLRTCDQLRLDADIRWGQRSRAAPFSLRARQRRSKTRSKLEGSCNALPDEVARLVDRARQAGDAVAGARGDRAARPTKAWACAFLT